MPISEPLVLNCPVCAGRPYPMDLRCLNRLLGRGGRIADTPDPHRYAAVFRRLAASSLCFAGSRPCAPCGMSCRIDSRIRSVRRIALPGEAGQTPEPYPTGC
jgi:hypothetical protein